MLGGNSVKGQKIIILVLILANGFGGVGVTLIDPIVANGQAKERIILSQESGRDPFLLPPGVHLLSKIGTALGVRGGPSGMGNRADENLMKVKAILISDHARLALIDRHIVTVGDSIRGEKVLEIKTDRVTLGKGDQKRTLLLSQSPVRLTVEEKPPYSDPSPQGGREGGAKGE
jgi:hypothetical protein